MHSKSMMAICEMKDKLVSYAMEECCRDKSAIDTDELGKVVDMIKDLADAEKNLEEAAFKKEELQMARQGQKMGYDNWRTSSGRFADKGTGTYYGYSPFEPYDPDIRKMMGYPGDGASTGRGGSSGQRGSNGSSGSSSRYGYPYENYQNARMGHDQAGMDKYAKEHAAGVVESMRDIWQNADPQLREKLKQDMSVLAEEMDL